MVASSARFPLKSPGHPADTCSAGVSSGIPKGAGMFADAISSALAGMQRNQEAFARHAHRIANAGNPGAADPSAADASPVNLHEELAGILVSRRGWEANLVVLRAADGMMGTLIDMFA